MDEEIERIKRKKLEELQRKQLLKEQLEEQQRQIEEIEAKKKIILRMILTPRARERLGRIKIARPQIAESIENQLIAQLQTGRLRNKINDQMLKSILEQVIPKKRDIHIRRK